MFCAMPANWQSEILPLECHPQTRKQPVAHRPWLQTNAPLPSIESRVLDDDNGISYREGARLEQNVDQSEH
jgi:hypothetical protein